MTDHVSEVLMLPTVESQQIELNGLEIVEDKESPSSQQITLKYGDAFLVTDVHGDLLASKQDMGLYWHGTRFLRTCNLYLENHALMVLSHHISKMGEACQIDLTNKMFRASNGVVVKSGAIHVDRLLQLQHEQLVQTFTITSFCAMPVTLTLGLQVEADFCDLFEVRGLVRKKRGQVLSPKRKETALTLRYHGLDNVERMTHIEATVPPDAVSSDSMHWRLQLTRGQSVEIRMTVRMSEMNAEHFTHMTLPSWHDLPQPKIHSNDALFNRLLARGMDDLMMLSTMTPHGYYPYAGIPWFSCPFGRDGLISCLEFLPWFPAVVRGVLTFLSAHQGTKVDEFTDEEPGKMLHEMRTGEMANCREIPYLPYYGSIDVTPLFLIALADYMRWTHDQALLTQLWPHAEAAARWMISYGDRDGDGFLEYHKASVKGLANQGWKDAWDSISHCDGQIAQSPIALCEVQGYAYAAYRAMSSLAGYLGKEQEARYWEQRAEKLQASFLEHFWWEEEDLFYLALDAAKKPCRVVSSNAGQCLWTGIVPAEISGRITDRLMCEDMYSGWGIRTLSTHALRYNPMSYHNGSVWPHDSALVGAGFARYGRKKEAVHLLRGLYQASLYFEGGRLPELYCGFPLRQGYGPTRYPVACAPQAWAAGAPFLLLNALLGLQSDAEGQRLILDRPLLPNWLQAVEIQGLRLGHKQIHLNFIRSGEQSRVIIGADNEVEVCVR